MFCAETKILLTEGINLKVAATKIPKVVKISLVELPKINWVNMKPIKPTTVINSKKNRGNWE